MTFGKTDEMLFLGREMTTERNYSEKMAERIDDEVSKFIHQSFELAEKIIHTNRKALDTIASTLIEKETLEQDDFYELLKPFKIKPTVLT